MSEFSSPDIVVVGGGVSGLWILSALLRRGYRAALLSEGPLGAGQTLAAQGVIHGGLKYALGGKLSDSSEALKAMPGRWKACLEGRGEIDLHKVEQLSPCQHLWSLPSVMSQVMSFFGSKALSGRAARLPRAEYPPALATRAYEGSVFRLEEMVVNPASLVAALAHHVEANLYAIDWSQCRVEEHPPETTDAEAPQPAPLRSVVLPDGTRLAPKRWILAAGAGNATLLSRFGQIGPPMQRRPLHQVLVRHPNLTPFYSVCIGTGPKPPLVTTTHVDDEGRLVWYLGGDLAETGVARSEAEQIEEARQLLAKLLPWLDLAGAEWSTLRVDRAEPKTESGTRVPDAFTEARGDLLTVWPSKLALAPRAADQTLEWLKDLPPPDATAGPQAPVPLPLPRPELGRAPWQ